MMHNTGIRKSPSATQPKQQANTTLPEPGAVRLLRTLYAIPRIVWIAIPAIPAIWFILVSSTLPPASPKQVVCRQSPLPDHGLYKAYSSPDRLAQLTIDVPAGGRDARAFYFINLEDTRTGHPAMLFFAYGGLTLNHAAPIGTFMLKYAIGQRWCGDVDLFGDDTSFNEAMEPFVFKRWSTGDGYGATHWKVKLIPQQGGNLQTKEISRDNFF